MDFRKYEDLRRGDNIYVKDSVLAREFGIEGMYPLEGDPVIHYDKNGKIIRVKLPIIAGNTIHNIDPSRDEFELFDDW